MYWLVVERLENWEADKKRGFRQFGIPDSKRKSAGMISKGDLLIAYVSSGVSSFADLRRVESDGLANLPPGTGYDEPFSFALATSPVVVLERDRWIKIHDLISELELTRHARDWRQLMRVSFRRLENADGELLHMRIMAAANPE